MDMLDLILNIEKRPAFGNKIDKIDELLAKFGGKRNTWKKMSGKDS